jgi:hypothetical protein
MVCWGHGVELGVSGHKQKKTVKVNDGCSQKFTMSLSIRVLPHPNYHGGFFSIFCSVIGAVDHFVKKEKCSLEVDLETEGCYYERKRGPNWWSYYFDSLLPSKAPEKNKIIISSSDCYHLAFYTEEKLSRQQAFQIIRDHITIKPEIVKSVTEFVKRNLFSSFFMVGVHYRGTDKSSEAPRILYSQVEKTVRQILERKSEKEYRLFVATDEQPFIQFMEERFSGKVICCQIKRAGKNESNGIHTQTQSPYETGTS